jgi:hypothetical protein
VIIAHGHRPRNLPFSLSSLFLAFYVPLFFLFTIFLFISLIFVFVVGHWCDSYDVLHVDNIILMVELWPLDRFISPKDSEDVIDFTIFTLISWQAFLKPFRFSTRLLQSHLSPFFFLLSVDIFRVSAPFPFLCVIRPVSVR